MKIDKTNKLFGWKPAVVFRDVERIEKERDEVAESLERLDLELKEARVWHKQRLVYDGIAAHLSGDPLTEDQECALQYGWEDQE